MHEAFFVQMTDCNNELSGIELSRILCKPLVSAQDSVHLASLNKRHYKVEAQIRLEEVFHAAKKWMIKLKQDVFLQTNLFQHLIHQYLVFANRLNRKLLAGVFKLS